jgi:hypothetical protein
MFNYFYHSTIRKSVSIFGSLFNNIYILRKNSAGAVISQVKCPLTYSPKRNFIERLNNMAAGEDAERQLAVKLPRISFEILDISYQETKQLIKTVNYNKTATTPLRTQRNKIKQGAPYQIGFEMNIYAKSQDDALQVVEQILPYFTPQYSVTIKPLADIPTILQDVPISLNSVSFTDDYEADMGARRTIIYTLSFTMETVFHGPTSSGDVITTAIMDLNLKDTGLADSDTKLSTITVTPNPTNIVGDSDYGFTTVIDLSFDSA